MKKLPLIGLLTAILFLLILNGDEVNRLEISPVREEHIAYINSFSGGLAELPDAGLEAKMTYPYQAAFEEYIKTMDPSTRMVPVNRRAIAVREALAKKRERKLKSDPSLLQWESLSSNTGGRARALMFDPTDPDHKKVWAGAVTGGLWYTEDITDTSERWKPVDDFWENLAIGSICHDPNDPKTFYVGTGEGQTAFITYRESSGTGRGIMRSRDAGETWELLPSTTQFAYITDIQVRDEDGKSVLYVATKSGDYKGKIFEVQPDDGLYRSTDDGQSWTQVLPKVPGRTYSYSVADIEITSSGRIFVGTTNNLELTGGGTILWSDNGVDWTVDESFLPDIKLDPDFNLPGRVMLASAPSDPNRIYALFGSGAVGSNEILYIYCIFIARSDDGGQTWTKGGVPYLRNNPDYPYGWAYIAWHALTAAVDPEDPDILYIGGCDIHRTDDGGKTWHWISDTQEASLHVKNTCRYVHADQHALVLMPGSRDYLVNANDGGIFITPDARDSIPCWTERNEDFNTMQYYTAAIHPEAGKIHYLGGTQDNSTMHYDGKGPVTDDRSRWLGGDGMYCFIDEDEPDINLMSIQWNYYAFTRNLDPDHEDEIIYYTDLYRSGLFVNPADYDSRSNTLFGNATTQWGEYVDHMAVIKGIPTNPTGNMVRLHSGAAVPFSAVKLSPHSPVERTVLYMGTQSGRLFKIHDANNFELSPEEIGASWFPAANISCIELGNTEADLLVTFSNYGVPSVYLSRDGGNTWADKEANLPDIPVRWALWHPDNRNYVLLASEVGVWSTRNFLSEDVVWEPELEGFANVRVDMIRHRVSDDRIIAASHGRGMYHSTWQVPADTVTQPPDGEDYFKLFPNPSYGMVTIQYTPVQNEDIIVEVFDRGGKKVYSRVLHSYVGQFEKTIDLSTLSSGAFTMRVSIGEKVKTHQLVIAR